ncbi:DUF6528 family protein [candidate division KSB1 bacterium]
MIKKQIFFAAAVLLAFVFWSKVLGKEPKLETINLKPFPIQKADELIICGWDEVFIIGVSQEQNGSPKKLWSWKAEDRQELPEHMRSKFKTTDDCKPVYGLSKVLITSSSGGVALVDRKTGKVSFYATVANAHSADVLPRDRIAVAASHAPGGDRIIVFDLNLPEKELCSYELPWGHGVVWDEGRQILWALSGDDIRAYRLENWDSESPSLSMFAVIELPEGMGHDFYPIAGTPFLIVTTSHHCWLFDRDKRSFKLHPDLAEMGKVKCISVNPVTGQLVYVQAEGRNWWTEKLHFLHPDRIIHMPGEHFYKARWNVELH